MSSEYSILADDLRLAWRHAVRAYNYCENSHLTDTQEELAHIIVGLSQSLEFAESMEVNDG